ncbi:MAG: heavy metal translocating P-type ATPase metal-binding domain-containing protein [Cytophagaceae bacterium]|nr:heavy metal translocating P-type ATPase metal-binding domain-containing protein [Cytophagaceae bacterium]
MANKTTSTHVQCFHCGDACDSGSLQFHNKSFCCQGCKSVYELLQSHDLCTYYDLETMPGIKVNSEIQNRYAFLADEKIIKSLLDFDEEGLRKIRFNLPGIHCSSCIWLLENLEKLCSGVQSSQVNFQKKEISVLYQKNLTSAQRIAETLHALGYPPSLQWDALEKKSSHRQDWSLLYKIGIAGFCGGNIMLLSFPEYLGLDTASDKAFARLFSFLSLFLSIPVVVYGASEYFINAYKGLRKGILNLDVPIALGTAAVFFRSVYEVITQIGPGYFDSLTGLIFFLLIGKWYQQRTYRHFSFERDYHSYFPLTATIIEAHKESPVLLHELKEGDEVLVRNQEIIPADAVLLEGNASINYSFVTGEQKLIPKSEGELLFAGGRQEGSSIRIRLQKNVSSSYLLQLWNHEVFSKSANAYLSGFVLSFSKYFVYATLLLALGTGLYWYWADSSRLLFAVTAVLLVACPCALALSLPFALSNALRILGKHGFFLKNADTVEKISETEIMVFDKTGTLTHNEEQAIHYEGLELSHSETLYLKSALRNSTHPISRMLYGWLSSEYLPCEQFQELPGKGLEARVNGHSIKAGSARWLLNQGIQSEFTRVYVEIDHEVKGYFQLSHRLRSGIPNMLNALQAEKQTLHVLSGDGHADEKYLRNIFPKNATLLFRQQPEDKLRFIQSMQQDGKKVMMLGDGLNDAGALQASDAGIAVCDNINSFAPSCDGILLGKQLYRMPHFIRFTRQTISVVKASLVLSVLYNLVGLYFAVQAQLSPVIAAILMPMSSVSVVAFVVLLTNYFGSKLTAGPVNQ